MGPRQGDDAQERRERLVVPDRADSQNAQSPARVVKRYSPPATPCDRLMQHDAVSVEMKAALSEIGSSWMRWRSCTPSGKPSRPWRRLRSPKSGPLPAARAWNSSWPNCPTGGVRMQRIPHGSCGCNRPAPGELGQTLSKEYGATCCPGCRKTRTPVRWNCWADWKRLNRIVSAGLTCVRCSAGCSNGAASWPKSWSTPRGGAHGGTPCNAGISAGRGRPQVLKFR